MLGSPVYKVTKKAEKTFRNRQSNSLFCLKRSKSIEIPNWVGGMCMWHALIKVSVILSKGPAVLHHAIEQSGNYDSIRFIRFESIHPFPRWCCHLLCLLYCSKFINHNTNSAIEKTTEIWKENFLSRESIMLVRTLTGRLPQQASFAMMTRGISRTNNALTWPSANVLQSGIAKHPTNPSLLHCVSYSRQQSTLATSRSPMRRATQQIPASRLSRAAKIAPSSSLTMFRTSVIHHPASPLHCNIGALTYSSTNPPGRFPPPSTNNNRRMGALGALGTGAVVLFGKTKYLIGALKLTKLARCVWLLLP